MFKTAQLRDCCSKPWDPWKVYFYFFCWPQQNKLGVLDYLLFTPGEILVCGLLMWSRGGRGVQDQRSLGADPR